MDEKLEQAIDDFITARLDDLATDAPGWVTEAVTEADERAKTLVAALDKRQAELWHQLENAQILQNGEETRYYYRSGFHDAVRFLMDWDDRP